MKKKILLAFTAAAVSLSPITAFASTEPKAENCYTDSFDSFARNYLISSGLISEDCIYCDSYIFELLQNLNGDDCREILFDYIMNNCGIHGPSQRPDEPDEPGDTENPDEPGEPESPGDTENPDEPGEPENPGDTENPDEPGEPENPGDTENPDEPSEPENPGDTENPDEPGEPENPGDTENPDEPGEPENPGDTDIPDEPGEPENPGDTDIPDEPGEPENPGDTESPDEPSEPENPGDTDIPDEPGEPENPGDTDIPVIPDMPHEPDDGTHHNDGADQEAEFAAEVVRLVNIERAKAGLSALETDYIVQEAAQVRAREIELSFSHTRPDGRSCFTTLDEVGAVYSGAGENIAYGQHDPEEVMEAWMNSTGHRENILNESYTHIGVGCYESGGTYYWSQFFTH